MRIAFDLDGTLIPTAGSAMLVEPNPWEVFHLEPVPMVFWIWQVTSGTGVVIGTTEIFTVADWRPNRM